VGNKETKRKEKSSQSIATDCEREWEGKETKEEKQSKAENEVSSSQVDFVSIVLFTIHFFFSIQPYYCFVTNLSILYIKIQHVANDG